MTVLLWIVASSFIGGVLSAAHATLFALNARVHWVNSLVNYAIRALLGAAFLEILPEALKLSASVSVVSGAVPAIIAHEIPQEVGDFMILPHSGYTKAQALLLNLVSSLATLLGGVLAYYALRSMQSVVPILLALAAASMIYVAVADLIPGLHKRTTLRDTLEQVVLIAFGISSIVLVQFLVSE
ncbi:MAG: ZIP family metal transporter [Gallionella sp.]